MLTLTLLLGSKVSRNVYAGSQQKCKTQVSVDDDTLKQLEVALAELESLRRVKSLHLDQINALEAKCKVLEDLVAIERQRAEAYKAADAERATANALDDKRIALYTQMVADYKVEVARLRVERDKSRGANKFYLLAGIVLGTLLGWAAQK